MNKRILITGPPGCGKTTLVRKIADIMPEPICGFFTGEIREGKRRVGFDVESFSGKKAVLSHMGIESPHSVGRYKVNIEDFEKIAIPEIEEALHLKKTVIIDEIGKMELCSKGFQQLILSVFESEIPFIGTILFKPHPFCDRLKSREGVDLLVMSKGNRDEILNRIIARFKND